MPRETNFNDDLGIDIAIALEEGNTITDACAAAKITTRTYHKWIARGRAGEEPFVRFFHLTQESRAKARRSLVRIIRDASELEWKAACWLLERMDRKHWGKDYRPPRPDESASHADVQRAVAGILQQVKRHLPESSYREFARDLRELTVGETDTDGGPSSNGESLNGHRRQP